MNYITVIISKISDYEGSKGSNYFMKKVYFVTVPAFTKPVTSNTLLKPMKLIFISSYFPEAYVITDAKIST